MKVLTVSAQFRPPWFLTPPPPLFPSPTLLTPAPPASFSLFISRLLLHQLHLSLHPLVLLLPHLPLPSPFFLHFSFHHLSYNCNLFLLLCLLNFSLFFRPLPYPPPHHHHNFITILVLSSASSFVSPSSDSSLFTSSSSSSFLLIFRFNAFSFLFSSLLSAISHF